LNKLKNTFSDPTKVALQVGKAILFHGKSIWNDASHTVSDFEAHQYKNAGHDIGDLIKIIFLKRRSETPIRMNFTDAVQFIEGLVEGMLHDSAALVESCIQDAQIVIVNVEKAFGLI
jgi:hypothetical protein